MTSRPSTKRPAGKSAPSARTSTTHPAISRPRPLAATALAGAGRTAPMRQHYEIQRDSWSGWRPYGERGHTLWTPAQDPSGGPVAASCPRGRVGTYTYRLAVTVEVAGRTVDDSPAASPQIRTDCGTGVS
ncbi:hypothetical protein [Streptomyces sp. NPDC004296]|uniref:hypothetical protein n=1 Tax=Streptomyces sp. NPDC004296 TaxID=3364697 RepID=UPI0036C2DE7C